MCICLPVGDTVSCAKIAELIAMLFAGPRNHVLDGVQIPMARALLRGTSASA